MKGSVSLNPKFSTLNIKNVRILKIDPLIACDQRHLYFKGTDKNDAQTKCIRWEDKNVINCTYLKKYKIILALCQNYRLYALTQNLQEITSLTGWQSKYSLAFQFIQQYGILLMIGAETVEIIRISIETNIKKTKFLSSMKFNLRKTMPQPVIAGLTLPWNKGYNFNVMENLLYVWSPQSIAFLQLSTLQLLSQSHNLTKKQHPITCIYLSPYFKYTLTGTSCGQIHVWRLPLSKKFQHENVMIHTFEAHGRSVNQIVESKYNQKIIMTSAQDAVVRVWSLQTFQMLRSFQFSGIYTDIHVKSIDEAFVFKDHILGQLSFGQSLEFITEITSNISMIDRQIVNGVMGNVSLTLQQNLGLVLQTDILLRAKELNKMEMKYIYPPLKAKAIKQIVSSPFCKTVFYLLAQNGQLFRVNVPPFTKQYIGVSSKIEQAYNIQFVCDRQKHPINQLPCIIDFFSMLPPQFDSQIREVEDLGGRSQRQNDQDRKPSFTDPMQKYNKLKLMTIGCQKGSIIFLSCDNMSKIYARLTYHRQRINFIQCVKEYKTSEYGILNGMVASVCAQNYLKLVKFDYEKSIGSCILTYYAGQELKMLRSFQTFLTVVFYKGQFQITQIEMKGKTQDLCCRRSSVIQNHEGQILSIDYEQRNQLILTAGTDNRIKLWTTKKILIYDILLDHGLSSAFFMSHSHQGYETQGNNTYKNTQKKTQQKIQILQDEKISDPIERKLRQIMKRPKPEPVDFDMIISHNEKLLYFHHIPLSFRPNQIQSYNSNPELLDDQKVTLKQIFENYTQKPHKEQSSPKLQEIQQKKISHRQRVQTQPNQQNRKFFTEQSRFNDESVAPVFSPLKNLNMKTQVSNQRSHQSTKRQLEPLLIRTQKNKHRKTIVDRQSMLSYKSMLERPGLVSQSSIEATKKHLKQLSSLKQQINVNRPVLPKLTNKKEDIFDQFMREKLVNKSVLTRRDITINRIIMKNIIKEHFQQESKMVGLRLDY